MNRNGFLLERLLGRSVRAPCTSLTRASIAATTCQELHPRNSTHDTARIKHTFECKLWKLLYSGIYDCVCVRHIPRDTLLSMSPVVAAHIPRGLNLTREASDIYDIPCNVAFVHDVAH